MHLRRPSSEERPTNCDYHVFREGIRPMWEDSENQAGGKWIVRLKKGLAARYWEDLARRHRPLPPPPPPRGGAAADAARVPLPHPSPRASRCSSLR